MSDTSTRPAPTAALETTPIPTQIVGPMRVMFEGKDEEVPIPLATYESPLWPSTNRGARVSVVSGGIQCTLVDDRMSRSILVEAPDAGRAVVVSNRLKESRSILQEQVSATSRFAQLIDIHTQLVGSLLYIRFAFTTGDASGHNMATKAADRLLQYVVTTFPDLKQVSVSGNYCTDKKTSAVNGILGRGKYVVCELTIPEKICRRYLKTSAKALADLNIRKNLIGTLLAGGVRTANAHVANILLAFYLATGQDAANIVEGSQSITHIEDRDGDAYVSLTLPNLIVGTVGNGKNLEAVERHLALLSCREERSPGANGQRLAVLCGAAALCGELSLMAALTNPGELMDAHTKWERS